MSEELKASAFPLLALDISGTKVGWAIISLVGEELSVQEAGSIPTLAKEGGAQVASRICELVAASTSSFPEIKGVAVASAGVVDPRTGKIVSATNTMPGWGGTDLGDLLREASGRPVWILNDVHAHGLGEARLGAGVGHDTVLSVAVGTGIGGALIHNGEVVFGSHNLAGHLGHIHHHFAPEMTCSCGRMGHIEAFCSGSGITAWYEARRSAQDPEALNGRRLQDLADSGHPLAAACFTESAYALGEALGSLANCVDPAIIVLSGSMTRSGEAWWGSVREGYRASAMNAVAELDIVVGSLGSNAPLLGAVIHYLNQIASS